jgi:hypothetical protein
VTRVRLHWSIKVFENYSAEFELEKLPADLRAEIDSLVVEATEEDGTPPFDDVIDFTWEDDVDQLVSHLEENAYSSAVEERYIHGFELMKEPATMLDIIARKKELWGRMREQMERTGIPSIADAEEFERLEAQIEALSQ